MEAMLETCCGLDVHKSQITACVLTGKVRGNKEIRTFSSFTEGLRDLKEWLRELGCRHVAMESTGVYWKPVFNILEDDEMELMLVNPRHIKNVPGRKSDVQDCEWIAKLYRAGLLRGSFIPPRHIRELRDLCRYRIGLVRNMTQEKNRIAKVLEDANIKLKSVVSEIAGKSSLEMIGALLEDERDIEAIAQLGRSHLRNKIPELMKALEGEVREHHKFMLGQHMEHLEQLGKRVEEVEQKMDELVDKHQMQENVKQLDTIPGVNKLTATGIIAEIGTDMGRFSNEQALSSWATVCPGSNESAGKKKVLPPEKGEHG